VGCSDDACFDVCKQDGLAVGGQNAQRNAGRRSHHSVGFWGIVHWSGYGHNVCGMKLMNRRQMISLDVHSLGHAPAIYCNDVFLVRRAKAAVQPFVDP
jgi:hypothetical protein